jgi:hypothetical protein
MGPSFSTKASSGLRIQITLFDPEILGPGLDE